MHSNHLGLVLEDAGSSAAILELRSIDARFRSQTLVDSVRLVSQAAVPQSRPLRTKVAWPKPLACTASVQPPLGGSSGRRAQSCKRRYCSRRGHGVANTGWQLHASADARPISDAARSLRKRRIVGMVDSTRGSRPVRVGSLSSPAGKRPGASNASRQAASPMSLDPQHSIPAVLHVAQTLRGPGRS